MSDPLSTTPGDGAADAGGADAAPSGSAGAALRRLDGLAQLPPAEHPDVYQAIHAELQRALAGLDDV